MELINETELKKEDIISLKRRAKASARMSENFITKKKEFKFKGFTVTGTLTQKYFAIERIIENN